MAGNASSNHNGESGGGGGSGGGEGWFVLQYLDDADSDEHVFVGLRPGDAAAHAAFRPDGEQLQWRFDPADEPTAVLVEAAAAQLLRAFFSSAAAAVAGRIAAGEGAPGGLEEDGAPSRAAGEAAEAAEDAAVTAPVAAPVAEAEGLRLHLSSTNARAVGEAPVAAEAAAAAAVVPAPVLHEAVEEAEGLHLHLSSNSSTGYKGVSRHSSGRFQAQKRVDGRQIHIGYCGTAVGAAVAYARAAGDAGGSSTSGGGVSEDAMLAAAAAAADPQEIVTAIVCDGCEAEF